eukprot:XP_006235238.1 PREDICTED: insulinoma-associated protein 1 isoform X1 [Rattus norvegicus]
MPRGFLVKRSKKSTPVSYRVRGGEDCDRALLLSPGCGGARAEPPVPSPGPLPPPPPPALAERAHAALAAALACAPGPPPPPPGPRAAHFGNPEAAHPAPLYSPTRPVSREHEKHKYFERSFNLGSPVSAESFPTPAALLAGGGGGANGAGGGGGGTCGGDALLFAPAELKMGTAFSAGAEAARGPGPGPPLSPAAALRPPGKRPAAPAAVAAEPPAKAAKAPSAKKPKAIRKLHFEDEVTTSPVLGCGETFPSKGAQERHLRLLHAAQVFPCKYCPATFYSSPGLTRHINKCHPSENRQVILLQVPVRPAC